jgi:hypothetical protein
MLDDLAVVVETEDVNTGGESSRPAAAHAEQQACRQ